MDLRNNFEGKRKDLLSVFFISMVVGIVAFMPVWIHFQGQYMDYGDYFLQYVPFIKELKRMVFSGSLSWSWNSFLGDSFIGAYSYYTVFNPFAWVVMLFPDQYILYGTMLATLLKLGVCAVSSLLYIRLFCNKAYAAKIGAFLYTFSGFTLVNTNFYFFLDVVAVFPFLLYGLELIIRNQVKKNYVFVLAVFINAIINYYFFVSTVMLAVIYVFFRLRLYCISSWKVHFRTVGRIFGYGIVGAGLAGFALVPSFYKILGSGKAMGSIGGEVPLFYWPQNILERVKTLVSPIESGRFHAFYDSSTWSSVAVYLPVVGIYGALLLFQKKKLWLKGIYVFLLLCFFIPWMNAVFNLFSSSDYTRWLYGLVLLLSVGTAMQLEDLEEQVTKKEKRLLLVLTVFTACLLLAPAAVYFLQLKGINLVNKFFSASVYEYFMGYPAIVIMLLLTALNYAFLWWFVKSNRRKLKSFFKCVVIMCLVNFCIYNFLNYDLHLTEKDNEYYYQKSLVEGAESSQTGFSFRIDYPSSIVNYGLFKNMPSVNYYNSLQNSSSSGFAEAVGIGENVQDTILVMPDAGRAYLDALLSVKYYMDYDGGSDVPDGFQYVKNDNGVQVYENMNYLPMGFTYDSYCLEKDLETLSAEKRAQRMLETLAIDERDEREIQKLLEQYATGSMEQELSAAVSARKQERCSEFTGTSEGFTAKINLKKDNIVFFSVPDDDGWNILVNGKESKAYRVNFGLIGIPCQSGENTIVCTYRTPGMAAGIACSGIFAVLWLAVGLYQYKRRRPARMEI